MNLRLWLIRSGFILIALAFSPILEDVRVTMIAVGLIVAAAGFFFVRNSDE